MITRVDHWGGALRRLLRLAADGERRILDALAGWSTRRRWAVLVAVPSVMFCCAGTAIGAPIVWAVGETVEAGRGAPSPDAAADAYLIALGYGSDEGLLPILNDSQQDALLAQWRDYRAAMDKTTPRPSRFDYDGLSVTAVGEGAADVSVDVTAVWWASDGSGMSYNSTAETWTFRTLEDDGWRVASVASPQWCGTYVRDDACG